LVGHVRVAELKVEIMRLLVEPAKDLMPMPASRKELN